MENIDTEPIKVGDRVEMNSRAPKCMFRGIVYVVEKVGIKSRPMPSFVPDGNDCKTCENAHKCTAINTDESILNSQAIKLKYIEGEIDALYLKKAE